MIPTQRQLRTLACIFGVMVVAGPLGLGLAACSPSADTAHPRPTQAVSGTPVSPSPTAAPTTPTSTPADSPSGQPSTASPPPETSTPPLAPPTPPPGYTGHDLAGAEAAARYFLDLYAYSYHSGNTDALDAISEPSCEFCNDVIERVEALRKEGSVARGGEITAQKMVSFEPEGDIPYYRVEMVASQAQSNISQNGNEVETGGASSFLIVIALKYTEHGWIVVGLRHEELTGS